MIILCYVSWLNSAGEVCTGCGEEGQVKVMENYVCVPSTAVVSMTEHVVQKLLARTHNPAYNLIPCDACYHGFWPKFNK